MFGYIDNLWNVPRTCGRFLPVHRVHVCMYVQIPSVKQSVSHTSTEIVNVAMRNNVFFLPNLALLIKPGALHQQSQDFHKTETHCVKILFMYMLAAALVMNRKQV